MGRHITTAVTLLVLTGILVLGAVWGWKALFAEIPDREPVRAEPSPSCSVQRLEPGQKVAARQIRVSVFNAGTRSGLAGDTLRALVGRGFLAGDAGNAPSDADVRTVEVWSTTENDPRARLVALQFGKKVQVRFSDEDLGPGIDVVVGDRFRALVRAPRSLVVRKPQEVCVSTEVQPTDTPAA